VTVRHTRGGLIDESLRELEEEFARGVRYQPARRDQHVSARAHAGRFRAAARGEPSCCP
jgi:hypothetical protein